MPFCKCNRLWEQDKNSTSCSMIYNSFTEHAQNHTLGSILWGSYSGDHTQGIILRGSYSGDHTQGIILRGSYSGAFFTVVAAQVKGFKLCNVVYSIHLCWVGVGCWHSCDDPSWCSQWIFLVCLAVLVLTSEIACWAIMLYIL